MELVIPDGAQVHIVVGHAPALALQHEPSVAPPAARNGGRIVKTLVACVVLMGAFQAGRLLPHHADAKPAMAPAAQAPAAQAPAAQTTAAQAPPAQAPAAGTDQTAEIPPAFRAQLGQKPQLIPPPGARPPSEPGTPGGAAAPSAPTNPFGLQG